MTSANERASKPKPAIKYVDREILLKRATVGVSPPVSAGSGCRCTLPVSPRPRCQQLSSDGVSRSCRQQSAHRRNENVGGGETKRWADWPICREENSPYRRSTPHGRPARDRHVGAR